MIVPPHDFSAILSWWPPIHNNIRKDTIAMNLKSKRDLYLHRLIHDGLRQSPLTVTTNLSLHPGQTRVRTSTFLLRVCSSMLVRKWSHLHKCAYVNILIHKYFLTYTPQQSWPVNCGEVKKTKSPLWYAHALLSTPAAALHDGWRWFAWAQL